MFRLEISSCVILGALQSAGAGKTLAALLEPAHEFPDRAIVDIAVARSRYADWADDLLGGGPYAETLTDTPVARPSGPAAESVDICVRWENAETSTLRGVSLAWGDTLGIDPLHDVQVSMPPEYG